MGHEHDPDHLRLRGETRVPHTLRGADEREALLRKGAYAETGHQTQQTLEGGKQ